ncbi:hypothetical protein AYO20_09443 [Fonsecaea nubica]|uniref:Uncharacterized protein n=1 Tax=Fonsecaea nubica TaxID=856822 RepID=A0A178CHE8_9EURO|nr:hypothetical protein AYO20_09443 [Fonsecaea nubica]OAL28495.1 hypothetical protein AYO20_09443 [Fonsecaea nubica]
MASKPLAPRSPIFGDRMAPGSWNGRTADSFSPRKVGLKNPFMEALWILNGSGHRVLGSDTSCTIIAMADILLKKIPCTFKDPSLLDNESFIAGEWTNCRCGELFDVYDRYDEYQRSRVTGELNQVKQIQKTMRNRGWNAKENQNAVFPYTRTLFYD